MTESLWPELRQSASDLRYLQCGRDAVNYRPRDIVRSAAFPPTPTAALTPSLLQRFPPTKSLYGAVMVADARIDVTGVPANQRTTSIATQLVSIVDAHNPSPQPEIVRVQHWAFATVS